MYLDIQSGAFIQNAVKMVAGFEIRFIHYSTILLCVWRLHQHTPFVWIVLLSSDRFLLLNVRAISAVLSFV